MDSQLLWISLVIYTVAFLLALTGVFKRNQSYDDIALHLLALGLMVHAVSIALAWIESGHGPFSTMPEILSSNIFSLLFFLTLTGYIFKPIRPSLMVASPIILVMIAWLAKLGYVSGILPPTYNTIWLYAHVGCGKVFLGAAFVGLIVSGVCLIRKIRPLKSDFSSMPPDDSLDELAYRFMSVAFVFDTLMLISGAIWAQDAWGRYWAWDPLETWSFVTWLILALAIHVRITFKTPAYMNAIMISAVFTLAFLTFLGVPFISQSPHQGVI